MNRPDGRLVNGLNNVIFSNKYFPMPVTALNYSNKVAEFFTMTQNCFVSFILIFYNIFFI